MTPDQCRTARQLLGWSRTRLAANADVKSWAVDRLEGERGPIPPADEKALRATFEAAGIEFMEEIGGELGVRLAGAAQEAPDQVQGGVNKPSSHPTIDEDAI
ncbi:transcriptional regulator [Muricoccus radiodurans]|uniref:transcriptional regulator n=1 Tax=Muricoccus radiodurans TaxID=2231721 RepID=UPI003CEEB128